MNVFNRVVMILGILILIAVIALLLLLPFDTLRTAGTLLALLEIVTAGGTPYLIFLGVAGLLLLLLLILLWLELRRPQRRTVRIKTADKNVGDAQLNIESVAQSLEYRIDELAGVRKVEPHIVSHGRDVEVALDLDTSPSVNIPVLTDQIIELSRNILVEQLGLQVRGRIRVNIRHEPYPRGTMPPAGPLPQEAVTKPPTMMEPAPLRTAEPTRPTPVPPSPVVTEPASSVEQVPVPRVQPTEPEPIEVQVEEEKDEEQKEEDARQTWSDRGTQA